MSDPQELNLDQADGFAVPLCMLLAHGSRVAGYPQVAEIFDAAVKNEDARRYVLALLFKPDAMLDQPPHQIQGLAGLGQLVEILALVRQYLPIIKEYAPMAMDLLKFAKEFLDAVKAVKPSVPAPADAPTGDRTHF